MSGFPTLTYTNALVAGAGLALSLYALHVEKMKLENSKYQAYCDISGTISCSGVLSSAYSRGLGFIGPLLGKNHILNQPNPIFGIAFYVMMVAVGAWNSRSGSIVQFLLALASVLQSAYLGYLLYTKLHVLCLVCVACYIVNILLLVIAWQKCRRMGVLSSGIKENSHTRTQKHTGLTRIRTKKSESTKRE